MILYTTCYGSTKAIAQKLAALLDQPLYDATTLGSLDEIPASERDGELIVLMPLYAGGFYKSRSVIRLLDQANIRSFILISVGLANPNLPDNKENILKSANAAFPAADLTWFGLRGAMDYPKLSPVHRMMMAMFRKMVQKQPDDGEKDAFMSTYGKKVSLIDDTEIQRVARAIRELCQKSA